MFLNFIIQLDIDTLFQYLNQESVLHMFDSTNVPLETVKRCNLYCL